MSRTAGSRSVTARILMLLWIAVPVGILVLIWRAQLPEIRGQVRETLEGSARVVVERIDGHLTHLARDVTLIASNSQLRIDAATSSNLAYDSAEVARLDFLWTQAERVPTDQMDDPFVTASSTYLRSAVEDHASLREFIVADAHGRLAAGSAMTTDYYQKDEEWFAEWSDERLAECEGQGPCASFGALDWDDSSQAFTISISGPVFSNAGGDRPSADEMVGVYKAELDPAELAHFLDAVESSRRLDAYVTSDSGKVILEGRRWDQGAVQQSAGRDFFLTTALRERLCPERNEEEEGEDSLCLGHEQHEFSFDQVVGPDRYQIGGSRSRLPAAEGDWVVVLAQAGALGPESLAGMWLVFATGGLVAFLLAPLLLLARAHLSGGSDSVDQ